MRYLTIAAAALVLLVSCSHKENEMSAEEVVETFYRSVASGDFDSAGKLCDSTSMKDYIRMYAEEFEKQQKRDSSAARIAGAVLSNADFSVIRTEKDGSGRKIHYSLEVQSITKTKTARLKKEEGEW